MKSRVIIALFLSCVLIGGAGYVRFAQKKAATLQVIATEEDINAAALNKILSQASVQDTQVAAEPLTQTDVISRNFFSDYMSLKANGELTDDNISKLGEIYSSRILLDKTSPRTITAASLTILPDSTDNLTAYGQKMLAIRSKYESEVGILSKQFPFNGDTSNPNFAKLMNAISNLYDQAAAELEDLPVPSSMASNHANIVNLYLSNSVATQALASLEDDPIQAFSALSSQSQSPEQEEALYNNIRLALIQQGAYSYGQ
jgi:hypothetical protein